MQYENLKKLIDNSMSSRKYFMSLPVSIQIQLHEQNEFIHTQFELRKNAEYFINAGSMNL